MSNNSNTASVSTNKNSISSQNTTNGRLSSFGVPRDLTLGGLPSLRGSRGGISKKVYAPNLNVTRNKNVNVKTSKDTTRNNFKRNDNQKSNRGARRDGNLMQTSSIFSEGIASTLNKRSSESYSRRNDDVQLTKPTISKNHSKVDAKAESINLKALLGESDDNDGPEESFDKIDIKYKPVKFNKESDILARNFDDVNLDDIHARQIEKEFFDSNDKKIVLIQFPDVLPCECDENNISTGVDKGNETKNNEAKGGNLMDSLEEGQIGKLVRFKSGKCKLILGKTNYNVNIGLETGFLQELTSISTNVKERSGNIINLGLINSKMIISPDWDYLVSHNS
ncbi:DNA-directed RNA polymerase III subunit RPC4 [Condylostylus longicornis]|uniref:DNA-directed RNA polymerase III subunit RPC4 n=1 Tax=Condylostylus longicornis TaxID=2530218 RepID=UPI00244E2308|nr:DNA-directed RNA polymerase III subunit RPC4 [Condylostylus longicornis]